jgi:pimeloyl-ACP methyl ester carboxylesterase
MMTARNNPLPPAVSGERRDLQSSAGRLSFYTSGPTSSTHAPLLLIHSVNAAASAYEIRPLYEHYRTDRTVYALELPGFGFSDRSEREYTPRLMTDAIDAMVKEIARLHGPVPVDALALSLSCEFLARAASEQPGTFRSLALVSPTGFSGAAPRNGPPGSTRGMPLLRGFLTLPLWSRAVFALLTSRRSVRFFLEKTWGSKAIDEGMLEYDWLTARQPGAHHAPYCFVSGFLFSNDISRVYQSLAVPVFMVHGLRGDFVDYQQKQAFEAKPNWTIRVSPTGALPHFEMLEAFTRDYDKFLAEAGKGRPS